MRKFAYLLVVITLLSCESAQRVLIQKNLMAIEAEMTYIDTELGFVSLRWECANPPYLNQPCFKFMEFPIRFFENPQKGKKFIILESTAVTDSVPMYYK